MIIWGHINGNGHEHQRDDPNEPSIVLEPTMSEDFVSET